MSDLTFTDAKGRTWDLTLNLGIARAIDAGDFKLYYKPDFSFIKPDKEFFSALVSNQQFMWAVIWAVVQKQAREKFIKGQFLFGPYHPDNPQHKQADASQVDEAFTEYADAAELEFVEGINGNTIKSGREAFWRSLGDFFQDQATVLSVLERQWTRLQTKLSESVKEMEQDMEVSLDEALAKDKDRIKQMMRQASQRTSAN